jgi:glycosyltransferase involved in cell wall biosynthesis
MQADADRRLGFQPDIYQRYAFLAELVEAVFNPSQGGLQSPPAEPCRVLDVGSGPARLLEAFLPNWCEVVRADVSTFDDPDIIQIDPDASLPFPDLSFDIVLALDVLEHVPKGRRPALIAESQRVSSRSVIIGGPLQAPETVAAELAFADLARTVSGRDLEFLAEHARFGLPDRRDLLASFEGSEWQVETVENSPLAEWQVFNAVDFIYSCDLGEGDRKQATNALINRRAVFRRASGPHYRTFVCGFRRDVDADAMRRFRESAAVVGAPLSPIELAATSTELLARLRLDFRNEFERVVTEKDAHIAGLDGERAGMASAIAEKDAHIAGLDGERAGMASAIAEKDAHIGKLTDVIHEVEAQLSALHQAATEKDAALSESARVLAEIQARAEALERTLEERDRLTASLAQQLRRAEQELAVRVTVGEQLKHEVEALQNALTAIRSSRTWKLGAPMRLAGQTVRRLRRPGSGLPAESDATSPDDRQIDPLQQAYATISSSPLFDRQSYQRCSPEAAAASDPLMHYLTHEVPRAWNPHPLFDTRFYLERNPDVAASGGNPLAHYVTSGAWEGRDPHPLFDTSFYLEQNPDVAAAAVNPLVHYISGGGLEGRNPHPLFDSSFYLAENPDVRAAGLDPLVHYVTHGASERRRPHPLVDPPFYLARAPEIAASGLDALTHYITRGAQEGLDPHPLFDTSFYLEQNPDVATAGVNSLAHYILHGRRERRNPHPLFDTSFYLEQNPDVSKDGIDPLVHFVLCGAREGRDPHPSFDTSFYLEQNPDVAAAGLNPLIHYVTSGSRERRLARPKPIIGFDPGYVPPAGLLPWFDPLTISVSEALSDSPRLNVLVPGLAMKHMSGGPNTAIALACALAVKGVSIRFLSTDAGIDPTGGPFWDHVKSLAGIARIPPHMELVDAHDRSRTIYVGENDLFMATAWWTAQQAKYAVRATKQQTFLYLIQDYEPLLHAASTQFALASETYDLPHLPIINTSLLHEFLTSQRIGRFRDEAFARAALVFEPAVDRSIFHLRETASSEARRRLLFYTRPTNGLRNLFEMGVAALQKAVSDGVFDPERWEFVGMGEQFSPVALGRGAILRPTKWVTLEGYARQMRESDVLLSLMLSPHPSYPPLEMAASGGIVVTTTFGNKTAARLSRLSPNIIGVEPTIESIAVALDSTVRRLPNIDERERAADLPLPQNWSESFEPMLPRLLDELALLQGSPSLPPDVRSTSPAPRASKVFPGFGAWAASPYDVYRRASILRRKETYPSAEPGLLSFLTPVWNTEPAYLEALAGTVLGQDSGTGFEWIVLDNGTTRSDTRDALARLAQHPSVQLHRVERNNGIIGGMRFCLDRARNRYFVPLDSDDLLTPDAVRVLSHALKRSGYPPLAYSDEDKLAGESLRDPYFKPDWDPVLFVNSCYIAHLCAIDRQLAIQLGAYTDEETEGSHDGDTFARFYLAGHVPLHVPEVLYTWRMHAESTSGNIHSKPYVFDSQRNVLAKILAASAHPELYDVQPSPLFNATPDWWIRRAHRRPWSVTTVLVTRDGEVTENHRRTDFPHEVVRIDPSQGLRRLQEIAARCADAGSLVHLLWSNTTIEDQEWPWEAMAHFELFPDAVVIGGRIHDGRQIRLASRYFGFGSGCDSPDRGRALDDPGYFAQMWKQHSVSAVSIEHCVVRADFLRDALEPLAASEVSLAGLAPWLGAAAREAGKRVVYSPFFCASALTDPETSVTNVERAAFRAAYRTLIPEDRYLSPSLGLAATTAYRPINERKRFVELDAASMPAPYADWAAAEALARSVRYAARATRPTFSLLTPLYSGSEADVFSETARSLFAQRHPFAEWVILVQGPVPPALETIVAECATDPRVHVIRESDNVGIVKGLRRCLEHASSEYVVPMDGDDLLTADALQVLACEIRSSQPDLIYTDEDAYSDGVVGSPFFRPDFDRVLNAESSYVWHLCAYRRDVALRLALYTDDGAEFCHDWDTMCRFARAGSKVVHANHVLYHWRAHPASQSNSGRQNPGSIASTKFVLARTVAEQSSPALYQVVPFPIFRGAEEWCIQRSPVNPPSVAAVVLGVPAPGRSPDFVQRSGFPFRDVHDGESVVAAEWPIHLLNVLATEPELAVVVSAECDELEQLGIWEAVKLFEMHPEVAVVSGRLMNTNDVVVAGGSVRDNLGRLVSPFAGLRRTDAGPYAMALKAHCILCPADGLFVARAGFLRRAIEHRPHRLELPALPAWLGAFAIAENVRIAYSPLLQARVHGQTNRVLEGERAGREFRSFLETLGISGSERLPKVIGTAGFLSARREMSGDPTAAPSIGVGQPGERLEAVRG